MAEFRMWLWLVPDEITGKRRRTKYRMTEEEARRRFGNNAEKVEWSLELREPGGSTGDFQRQPKLRAMIAPGSDGRQGAQRIARQADR